MNTCIALFFFILQIVIRIIYLAYISKMEKIKLNNEIVSMRKFVKQAKVHIINKLVKQIKFLQNHKGNETRVQKAKRKAGRFLEAVSLIKKIKPDDVSKLALSKAKNWKAILQQKNSTLHDRCIAMLANYGAVQKEVEAFYSENKELVLKIPEYITQWNVKNKLSKDSSEIKKMSPIKKSSKTIQQANLNDENITSSKKSKLKTTVKTKSKFDIDKSYTELSSDEKVDSKVENSDGNFCGAEGIEDSNNDEDDSMKVEELDNDEENKSDEEEEINSSFFSSNNNNVKKSSEKESNINEMHKCDAFVKIENNTKNKLKAVALLNLNELEGLDEIPVNSLESDVSDEKESSIEINETVDNKNTDPFFLSHNKNKNPEELDDSSSDSKAYYKTKDSVQSFKHKNQTGQKNFHKTDNHFSPRKFQKLPFNNTNNSKRFENERNRENSFKREKFAPKNYHNKFHEKNNHNNQREFKLKSKSFSPRDTSNKKQFWNISKDYGNKNDNISLKSKTPFKKDNVSEPLHPSWQAKRKEKELLSTSFQGKRIVFND